MMFGTPPRQASLQAAAAAAKDIPATEANVEDEPVETEEELATCLLPHFLQRLEREGKDMSDPVAREEAFAAAFVCADAILRHVHDGHADFTGLTDDDVLAALASMPREAFEVLGRHAGGMADVTLPWNIRDCDGYDPAALAGHLQAVAPRLTYLALPTPKGDVVTLDLQGLRREPPAPPLLISVQRESESALTVLMDPTVGEWVFHNVDTKAHARGPTSDPLLPGTSRIIWMQDGAEVGRIKIPVDDRAYHHTALVTLNRAHDDKRQLVANLTSLNTQAVTATGRRAKCAQLTIRILHEWQAERIDREFGVKSPRIDGKHPALAGMHDVESIGRAITPQIEAEADRWWRGGGWTPTLTTSVGEPVARIMRDDDPGSERSFACWMPGLTGELSHGLPFRVRVKTDPSGATIYSVRVYDPNSTATWGRKVYRSLDDLARMSLADFIRPDWLASYVRPDAPICAIKEWPAATAAPSPPPAVPPDLRPTPEYVWAASLSGPECLRDALGGLLDSKRAPKPEELNPVFNKVSVLKVLLFDKDTECLRAFGRSIADARTCPQQKKLASHFIREIVQQSQNSNAVEAGRLADAAEAALAPLHRCVGAAKFVEQVLSSNASDDAMLAALERQFPRPGKDTLQLISDGIAAAFPPGHRLRKQWALALNVKAPP